jgi:heme exporter protein D
MTHLQFVLASYALTALTLGGLGLWLFFDRVARQRELRDLDKSGVKRRSEQ